MVVIFEQPEEKKATTKPLKELFWKPDGKVVLVEGKENIDNTKKKWKVLTNKEKERFKEGSYNPVYDLRGKRAVNVDLHELMEGQQRKNITFFNVIRI